MIRNVIVRKEKGKFNIVIDDSYMLGFVASDNKLFVDNQKAVRHEQHIMNDIKPDDRITA